MAPVDPIQRTRSRGLTLFEVLIALGIILALSAVVLPVGVWALRLGSLESARDGVEAVMLQARASARLEGRPIEVHVRGDRIEARWFDATSPNSGATASDDDGFASLETALADSADIDQQRIPDPWARRRLPSGITVLDLEDYLEELEALDETASFTDASASTSFPRPSMVERRVGVFLPGGGALVGRTIVLVASDGSALQVAVDPWTARPLIDPVLRQEPGALEDSIEDSVEDSIDEDDDPVLDQSSALEPEPIVETSSVPAGEPDEPTEEVGP